MAKPETTTAFCSVCKQRNKHAVLRDKERSVADEDSGEHYWDKYEIIQCCGCENISFKHTSSNSEFCDDDGQPIVIAKSYPSPHAREPIAHHYYLPAKVGRVYKESLIAMSNGAPILGAIGLRAVVEGICEDKKCIARNLARKIDKLVEIGALSSSQAEFLHLQRFMGNDAAHELKRPAEAELEAALSIVENLLTTLYVLPETAADMKKSQAKLAKMKAQAAKTKVP